jgi:protein-tyrosine-phosphatase
VYSAATSGETHGSFADARSVKIAHQIEKEHELTGLHGRLVRHKAKKASSQLLLQSDYICVMDESNYQDIQTQLRNSVNSQSKFDSIFYFGNFSRLIQSDNNMKSNSLDHYLHGAVNHAKDSNIMLQRVRTGPHIIIEDPWYGDMKDFDNVARIVLDSSKGLLLLLDMNKSSGSTD